MFERLLDESLLSIPRTRAPVQQGNLLLAEALLQALLQQPLEQVVKAIPPLALVQGHQKEVRALQLLQGGLHLLVRGITPHDRSTQPGAELL